MTEGDSMNTLQDVIAVARKESFTSEYPDRIDDAQALGVVIAHHFQWSGQPIFHAFLYALEDANYHSHVARIVKMFPELCEGANV